MQKTFHDFYQNLGFDKYPFRDRTAEKENTTKLFIKPFDYSLLEDTLSCNQSAIISGNRGTGKTIMLSDLKSKVPKNKLVCIIENFEEISLEDNRLDYYSLILQSVTEQLLIYLSNNRKILKKISYDDKIFLSFLILKYSDSISDSQFYAKIETVQLNWFQKIVNKISAPLTTLLNFGATTITNFGSEFLTNHFGPYLPTINEGSIRKIFPDIQFKVSNEFKTVEISYNLLNRSLNIVKNIMNSLPLVFIDKLDEDTRLENDAEKISSFIKDLICDNTLLLNNCIQLFISVWQIPFYSLSTIFRSSKHYVYDINWDYEQLEVILNQRLRVYSNNKITDYCKLFCQDVTKENIESIFSLSNANPRDLWGIFDEIFKAQFKIDKTSNLICSEAIDKGLDAFVKHFVFYEYYPKKKDARKNTNDIYSYIKHLLKLNGTDEFTNEELRQSANTGGSTTNYISGMMNIGLVVKTDNKRPGGAVIYKIKDPKVTYAIFNKIDIIRN